jgi:hypothetical protein
MRLKLEKEIIIPVIGILLAFGLLFINQKQVQQKEEVQSLFLKRLEVSKSVEDCINEAVHDAITSKGIDDEKEFTSATEESFRKKCLDFGMLEDEGYLVTHGDPKLACSISKNKHVDVSVSMPLTISKDKFSQAISSFSYSMRLESSISLQLDDDNRLKSEQTIMSSDGDSVLVIPEGTKVTYDGLTVENIQKIIIPTKRKNILGHIMYDIKPDGLEFSRPATLQISYEGEDIPSGTEEDKLRVVYCMEDECLAVPSTVDKLNKVITATITHTTPYGIDISCATQVTCADTVESYDTDEAYVRPLEE